MSNFDKEDTMLKTYKVFLELHLVVEDTITPTQVHQRVDALLTYGSIKDAFDAAGMPATYAVVDVVKG